MIEVLIIFNASYNLTREWLIVPRNEDPLQPGNYYVVSDGQFCSTISAAKLLKGPVILNNEPCLNRTISVASETWNVSFRNAQNHFSNWW